MTARSKPAPGAQAVSAPLGAWWAAEKEAARSPLEKFRTGAVIIDTVGTVYAKGCSYADYGGGFMASVHAEHHALKRFRCPSPSTATCVIVTLTRAGNYATSSAPCVSCIRKLEEAGIGRVTWAEKVNDGSWVVKRFHPKILNQITIDAKPSRYARHNRL